MKCDFCGHEVAPGTVECPYCHYQFKIDAQVLSPEERDTFEGVTIDESAGTEENKSAREGAVYDSGADAYNERQQQTLLTDWDEGNTDQQLVKHSRQTVD